MKENLLNELGYRSRIRAKIINDLPNCRIVQILYKHDERHRTVHPHIAFEAGTDNILISAFQTENPNSEASEPGWRDFAVKDINDVIFSDDRFEPASDFNPNAEQYGGAISTIKNIKGTQL